MGRLGSRASTEKNLGADYEQLSIEGDFFMFSGSFFRAVQILKFECTTLRSPDAGLGI